MSAPRVFIDRGGTFTDVVTLDERGSVLARKVPSDTAVVGDIARDLNAEAVVFGTTVATNALLERRVAKAALILNAGLEDLPLIGDMRRASLFDPDVAPEEPLIRRTMGVTARMDAQGRPVTPLVLRDEDKGRLRASVDGVEAVAVVLLHANVNPAHELALEAVLNEIAPGIDVVLGHRCVPERGLVARIETTMVDAAVTPVLRRALRVDRLLGVDSSASRLSARAVRAIRSDGSLVPVAELRAPGAVLSGPAGGVLAVAEVARACGFSCAVGLDMGGTSTDVCRVDVTADGGLPWREGLVEVAGVRVRRRMLEVETIAAGGGSVLSTDGLRLRVGPESAGAHPGPQCYGRGGPPTLTDAALALGLVNPDAFEPPLAPDRVELPGEASDFVAIAREAMAQAVRRLATARGVSLEDHALVAYGGAAGQHAAAVAELLGITTVLVHPLGAVMSALGQTLARREEERVAGIWAALDDASAQRSLERATVLAEKVAPLVPGGELRCVAELRYRSTDHTIDVAFDGTMPASSSGAELAKRLAEDFSKAHRERFGFDRALAIEVVHVRVRAMAPRPKLPPVNPAVAIELDAAAVHGPTVIHLPHTSIHLPVGWTARADPATRGLRLTRSSVNAGPDGGQKVPGGRGETTVRTPFGAELWGSRFQSVADEGGRVLERLAQSVNIRERLDFSVAVFDGDGQLVANAPHIPVHLGAMGATVRDLLADCAARGNGPEPGQAYLSNDPAAGGSHLPDLTVVTPVEVEGQRFFVASRGHHADVGGLTPGSMPPHSTSLADEGFVVRHLPLLKNGQVHVPEDLLTPSRQPDVLVADLGAQVAANAHTIRRLNALGPAAVVGAWMQHLQDVAAETVATFVERFANPTLDGPTPAMTASDHLDGVPLRLTVTMVPSRPGRADAPSMVFDFTGTGAAHRGNLNCPPAVARASVLYALRVVVGEDVPLNEGALRHVELVLPKGSILDPPKGAAIVGGNVETSQRLVDLVLRAVGYSAAGQGTMNNLTIGGGDERSDGPRWSMYETLGGGAGARMSGPGVSARQVHMTNTRATDPEVFESRLPLRLHRFQIRRDSGGEGTHAGGDGLVREIELLERGTAALLAPRDGGRPGLAGGGDGASGVDEVFRDGQWRPWDGSAVELEPGDRVRVSTPGGGGWGDVGKS